MRILRDEKFISCNNSKPAMIRHSDHSVCHKQDEQFGSCACTLQGHLLGMSDSVKLVTFFERTFINNFCIKVIEIFFTKCLQQKSGDSRKF